MPLVLFHHPFTRASSVVSMLEEVGEPYELRYQDLMSGEHKQPEMLARNPMGKIPVLVDGDVVISEVSAIGLYLADRYAPERLAPALDDPARAAYLRWSVFAPSVIEPGAYAHHAKWEYGAATAGWGTFESMHDAIEHAIGEGPWLLGERFSMADLIFGNTVRFLLGFGMLEERARMVAYRDRLGERPSMQAGAEINARIIEERGLSPSPGGG